MSRAARRALLGAALALGTAACGPRYATNGSCQQSSDCVLCPICGCARAYSINDIDTATCAQVGADVSCVPEPTVCIPVSAQETICVTGTCQVTSG